MKLNFKVIRKKIEAFILVGTLIIMGFPIGGKFATEKVQASTNLLFKSAKKMTESTNVDLTGDGKVENVTFKATKNNYECIEKLIVTVNGKTALTLKSLGYSVDVTYVKLSSEKIFLRVLDYYDNGDPTVDTFYCYDKKTHNFKKVFSLDTISWKKGACHVYSSVETSKGTLKVTYNGQLDATGYITWTYTYVYKNGKFLLKSDTAKVKSKWHKGDFVARKNITFYKNPDSKSVAFYLKTGETVKLKKIKLYKDVYYIMFEKGKKTGWISAEQYQIFENIILVG